MNQTSSTQPAYQSYSEHVAAAQRDRFVDEFDDAVLEQALRTVSWSPKDVANFLRTVSTAR